MLFRPETHGRVAVSVDSEVAAIQANQMIELLSAENTALKTELDLYYKKVSKLQKVSVFLLLLLSSLLFTDIF